MAIFEWESPKQAATYTKKVNRQRLIEGAMHLIVPGEPEQKMDKSVPLSAAEFPGGTISGKKPL